MADAARAELDDDVARAGRRGLQLLDRERPPGFGEHCGPHGGLLERRANTSSVTDLAASGARVVLPATRSLHTRRGGPYLPTWAIRTSARRLPAYDSRVRTVAYFGPPGTFTEEALLTQDDLVACERTAHRSVPDVIAAVEHGEFDTRPRADREHDRGLGVGHARHARLRQRPAHPAGDRPPGLAEPLREAGRGARRRQDRRVVPARARAVPRLARQEAARASTPGRRTRRPRRPPRSPARDATDLAAICNRLAADMYGLDVLGDRDRGPPREPDPLRAGRSRDPGADRARQDDDRVLPTRGPPRFAPRRSSRSSPHARST